MLTPQHLQHPSLMHKPVQGVWCVCQSQVRPIYNRQLEPKSPPSLPQCPAPYIPVSWSPRLTQCTFPYIPSCWSPRLPQCTTLCIAASWSPRLSQRTAAYIPASWSPRLPQCTVPYIAASWRSEPDSLSVEPDELLESLSDPEELDELDSEEDDVVATINRPQSPAYERPSGWYSLSIGRA